MARQFNRHQFAYPGGINNSEPRLGYRDIDAEGGVQALMHPAAVRGDYLPDERSFVDADDIAASTSNLATDTDDLMRAMPGAAPAHAFRSDAPRDQRLMMPSQAPAPASAPERSSRQQEVEAGVAGATPIVDRAQSYLDARAAEQVARQQKVDEAYQYGQQYLNNPFDAKGRARMGRQFMDAPLGGHVRRGLEGQELFGHTITGEQALMTERGLAGLTAVGVGVPAFLAAVNQLSTPQSPETIPL